MDVLVLGAGGHGQCVADALLRIRKASGELEVLGFLDDVVAVDEGHFAGLSVLGRTTQLEAFAGTAVIVAVGDNAARRRLFEAAGRAGHVRATVVDPTAVVGSEVTIGEGSYIGPLAIVGPGCHIGANVIVNGGGCLGHHNEVADHVHIGPGVVTARGARVGEGSMIGAGTVIKPDCGIGDGSVVGSGSLVARDVGDSVVAVGSPARAIRQREE